MNVLTLGSRELISETVCSERFENFFPSKAPDRTPKHAAQARSSPTDRFTSRNNLIRELQCMIIGSFGDKYTEGIKCSPKEKRPLGAGTGERIKYDFLPGVRGDAEQFQDMIRKD